MALNASTASRIQISRRMPSTTNTVVYTARVETPIGELLAAATDTHLVLLEFAHRRTLDTQVATLQRWLPHTVSSDPCVVLDMLRNQLEAYFRGTRYDFNLPLQ